MQVQNPEATQIIRDQAKLTVAEGFPQNLSSSIVPVMDMTPRFHRNETSFANGYTTSGNISLATSGQGKRFYITGYQIGIIKDATCDLASGDILVSYTQEGVSSRRLARIPTLTLTAQQISINHTLRNPILIDENSSITMTGTFTAGSMARSLTIFGYEVQK